MLNPHRGLSSSEMDAMHDAIDKSRAASPSQQIPAPPVVEPGLLSVEIPVMGMRKLIVRHSPDDSMGKAIQAFADNMPLGSWVIEIKRGEA